MYLVRLAIVFIGLPLCLLFLFLNSAWLLTLLALNLVWLLLAGSILLCRRTCCGIPSADSDVRFLVPALNLFETPLSAEWRHPEVRVKASGVGFRAGLADARQL